MNKELIMNPNQLVAFLEKPCAEFTKEDIKRYIQQNGIRMVNFMYPAGDGRLKTLNFVINNQAYLDAILTCGERVDGSSLFPFIEAGSSDLYVIPRFRTAFFSNQRYNHSFIDFFGMEADTYDFIKEDSVSSTYNPSDDELLKLVEEELAKGATKQFIVLHTYGSHFNYRERYPSEDAFFTPDYPMEAERKYRDNLVNAYDNSIRYTDGFLSRLIHMLEKQQIDAAMLYTSDHGEDIFDDSRHLFLHASPVPSYYQLHVPFLIWMSDNYRETYPEHWKNAVDNKDKNISSSSSFFPTMLSLAGIETPYRDDSQSVTAPHYVLKPRVYLNDHNEPRPLDDLGMKKQDFQMLEKRNIKY